MTSLLDLDLRSILLEIEKRSGKKLPREVIEVSFEPKLNVLCIRFKKPKKAEFGEPLHHGINLFTEKDASDIAAVEITDLRILEETAKKKSRRNAREKPEPSLDEDLGSFKSLAKGRSARQMLLEARREGCQ